MANEALKERMRRMRERGAAQPSQRMGPPAPGKQPPAESSITWPQAIGGGIVNFPGSVAKLIGNVVGAVASPIDSAKAIGGAVGGVWQGAARSIAGKPILGKGMIPYAQAAGNMYKEAWGSPEGFRQVLRDDPARLMADVTMLTNLAGGGARIGKRVASNMGNQNAANAAGRMADRASRLMGVTDPLLLSGRGAKITSGWVLKKFGGATNVLMRTVGGVSAAVIGITGGVGADGMRKAYLAQRAGGEGKRVLLANLKEGGGMRNPRSLESYVVLSKKALGESKNNATEILNKEKLALFDEVGDTVIGLEAVKGKITASIGGSFLRYRDIDLSAPRAQKMRKQVDDIVENWTNKERVVDAPDENGRMIQMLQKEGRDPTLYHTVEALDSLRIQFGQLLKELDTNPVKNAVERKIVGSAYHAVREAITEKYPGYGAAIKAYDEAIALIDEVEKAFSLGANDAVDVAMRKLVGIQKNTVATAYDYQRNIGIILNEKIGQMLRNPNKEGYLFEAVSGKLGSGYLPRGLSPWLLSMWGISGAGLATAGEIGSYGLGMAAPVAIATSIPRFTMNLARGAGQIDRRLRQAGRKVRDTGRAVGRQSRPLKKPAFYASSPVYQAGQIDQATSELHARAEALRRLQEANQRRAR